MGNENENLELTDEIAEIAIKKLDGENEKDYSFFLKVERGWNHDYSVLKGKVITICLSEGSPQELEKLLLISQEVGTIIQLDVDEYVDYAIFTQYGWKIVSL
jgi:hypothetical protein